MLRRAGALRSRWAIAAAVGAAAIAVAALGVAVAADVGLRETIVGDTVEARIAGYVTALARNDVGAATAAWRLDNATPDPALLERRRDITESLRSLGVRSHRIVRIDWWRTCCEMGLIDDPANAGLARATVEIWTNARYERYVFDVLARSTAYWGDAAGHPPHEWTLRDVYRLSEKPLFARFADPVALHPDVIAAVHRYYERYRDALLRCDVDRFWAVYPELAHGADIPSGVNVEWMRVRTACEQRYASASFDLERYAPLRVHARGDGADVSIEGFEWYTDARGDNSGGGFRVTLSLREDTRGWTVVRSDEVTLAEYHAQRH
jgi:hypothetical protein